MLEQINKMLRAFYSDAKFVKRLIDRRKLFAFLKTVEVSRLNGSRRVVFNLVKSAHLRYLLLDSFLAAKLSHRGVHPVVLIDDGILLHHEDEQYDSKGLHRIQFRRWLSRQCIKGAPLYRYYSEFVGREDRARVPSLASKMVAKGDFCFMGVDLWPSIEGSMVRYYKSSAEFLKSEKDYAARLRVSTENALLSCLVASRVEKEIAPDTVVTSHGIYTTWGPFYTYFKDRGKKALVYGKASHKRGSLKYMGRNEGVHFETIESEIDGDVARQQAESIMASRFEGCASDLERFGLEASETELTRILRGQGNREVFALFPNLFWDRSLAHADDLFDSCVDWMTETIRYFLDQPDKLLIVRAHPVEALSGKKPRIGAREIVQQVLRRPISEKSISETENVLFVPASVKVRSYSLFQFLTAGIVYNGTIGLEMMYYGLPVIVSGAAFYRDTPFVQRYRSRSEYFEAFHRLPEVLRKQESHREDLAKFVYYYFDLRYLPLPEEHFGTAVSRRALPTDPRAILAGETLSRIADDILAPSLAPVA